MSRVLPWIKPTDSPASAAYQQILDHDRAWRESRESASRPQPMVVEDGHRNPLRPSRLAQIVGQKDAKDLIRAAVRRAKRLDEALAHMLLVGPAGTGKSTLAHVAATELDVQVYQLAAPVSHPVLLELREVMRDRDVLFIDEIHLQAIQERRGREAITSPEVFFGVMEDHVIATARGVLPFPKITLIGGTTDEGMLSDAFLQRFPLRPRLVEYKPDELRVIARRNARTLGARLSDRAAGIFAVAARGTPREVNNLVKNAVLFSQLIDAKVAREVLRANGIEEKDGLTADMAALLRFVAFAGRRRMADDTVRYECSVNTIATGIGKSRDTKSVLLRIEPWLIRQGYLQITSSGRRLTDRGVLRAQELGA